MAAEPDGAGERRDRRDRRERRERPTVLTPEARMALAAWCGVTLVLLVVYAIVMLLL